MIRRTSRPALLGLAVTGLLLAGCGSGPDALDGLEPLVPPSDGSVGALTGLVVDDEDLPVAGVVVGVVARSIQTITDSSGRFALADLPPGSHQLLARKHGYEAAALGVAVAAGETTRVELRLVPVTPGDAYHVTVAFAGRFECSYAALDVVWSACAPPVVQGLVFPQERTSFFYEKETGAVDLVHELAWESTTFATGNNLDFSVVAQQRTGCQWYANHFGPSPLKIVVRVGQEFENPDSPYPVGGCGDKVIDDEDHALGVLILASPSYVSGTATVGLTVQQPYEGAVTVFYHAGTPPGFTAMPDA